MNSTFIYKTMYRAVDPFMERLRSAIVDMAPIEPGESLLDICCGTGSQVLHYSRKGVATTGIDTDADLIRIAIGRAKKAGIDASFWIGSALNLPFSDNSFDHALICLALHEKEETQRSRIISEMIRIVRVNGTLLLIDYVEPMPRTPNACFSRIVEFIAGREHYLLFKDFMRQKGLDGLVARNQLVPDHRDELGPLVVVKSINRKETDQ